MITIQSPAENSRFVLGQTVDIAFEAVKDLCDVTAVAATVGADSVTLTTPGLGTNTASSAGTVTPTLLGTCTLLAIATSIGGIGEACCDFTVNYDMSNGWLPPLSSARLPRANPRFQSSSQSRPQLAEKGRAPMTSLGYRASRLNVDISHPHGVWTKHVISPAIAPDPPKLRDLPSFICIVPIYPI